MKIKDYHIQSELGHGGMATVFLAHDDKFDTNVAIKVLNKEFVYNENIRKRFISEARSMFKMSHPYIIKVSDLIDQDDTVAFVMEYIEGETLKEYLDRKGKLSDEEIKNIFTQMLDAVGYVHEQNLVHRDIKPSNFMLDKKGRIKLMDFGIAKTTDTLSAEYTQTGTGVQMGTPMYMSPEQITETKSVTAQSDIYSLGAVLWQMVMGQKPYDVKTLSNFQLQSKIVNETLTLTNTIWDNNIQKATHKNIDYRYKTSHLFLNDLQYQASYNDEVTIFENKGVGSVSENKQVKHSQDELKVDNTIAQDLQVKDEPNVPHKKFKIYFLLPGIILFLIWVVGNIISERAKQRLFGDDDISGWLVYAFGIFILGLIIGILNKNKN